MTRYVYAAWDDNQSAEAWSPEAMLDALSNDLLQYGDLDWALQAFIRRGFPGAQEGRSLPGLSEFLQYLEQQKRAMLQHYAADSLQLAALQVAQFQQQVETRTAAALPEPDHTPPQQQFSGAPHAVLVETLRTSAAHLQDQLGGRRRQGVPRPLEGAWQATDVCQTIQRALEPSGSLLEAPEALRQQTLDIFTTLSAYLDEVHQLDRQLQEFPFTGSHPLSVAEAKRLLRAFIELDNLKQQLRQGTKPSMVIDSAVFADLLQPEQRQQLQALQQCEGLLEQSGLIQRTPKGLRLTARGVRQIGAKVLHEVFHLIQRGGRGQHMARRHGRPGALTGETKPYDFGETFDLHLGRTFAKALLRQPRLPLRLQPQDFEIQCREHLMHSATVIMLDMSHSMELFGRHRFTAAKKMALALAQLIGARFSHDTLHVVGFGDTAREIPVHELPYVTVGQEHTNTQEGLRLARRLLGRQRAAHKHILLITDGRPTAVRLHGKLHLHTWNLHPVILEETYKEAKRCREQHITLNTFMIADEEPLVQFVKRLTEISQGRAFYTTPERLGSYVIEDYVRRT